MVWEQLQYPRITQPVGDPSDWIESTFYPSWQQETQISVLLEDYSATIEAVTFLGNPSDFIEVPQILGWEPSTNQPLEQPLYYYSTSPYSLAHYRYSSTKRFS